MPLAQNDRQRLAALSSAMATVLLLMFLQAVSLPLLSPRWFDPLWKLSLIEVLSSKGVLILVAVWLVNLGAFLDREAIPLQRRRQFLGRCCRWLVLLYLLLIPLQAALGWSLLQLDQAPAGSRGLMPADASVVRASLTERRRVRRAPLVILQDSLQVMVSSLALAMAFATVAQRSGRGMSLRAEWQEAILLIQAWAWNELDQWLESEPAPRPAPQRRQRARLVGKVPRLAAAAPWPASAVRAPKGCRIIDAAYFEELVHDPAGAWQAPATAAAPMVQDAAAVVPGVAPPLAPRPGSLVAPQGGRIIDAAYFEELVSDQADAGAPVAGPSASDPGPEALIISVPLPRKSRPTRLPSGAAIDADYFEELAAEQPDPSLVSPPTPSVTPIVP